jgi:hypothetical protein
VDIVTSYDGGKDNKALLVEHYNNSKIKQDLLASMPEKVEKPKETKEEKKMYKMRASYFEQFKALYGRNMINLRRGKLIIIQ